MTYDAAIEILRRIQSCDAGLGESEVVEALDALCTHWVLVARGLSMRGVDGAPDWFAFERRIWDLGESVRQCLVRIKGWRSWSRLFAAAAKLVDDPQYMKGRESFVLLLGEFSAGAHREVLLKLLDDREVASHAIMALRHGKISDGVDKVRALMNGKVDTRTRTEAKKYLRMFA